VNLLDRYRSLSSKHQRMITLGLAIAIVLAVSALVTLSTKDKVRIQRNTKPDVTVLQPERLTGVEQFASQMNELKRQVESLTKAMEAVQKAQEEKKKKGELSSQEPSAQPLKEGEPAGKPEGEQQSEFKTPEDLSKQIPTFNAPPPLPAVKTPPAPAEVAGLSGQEGASSKPEGESKETAFEIRVIGEENAANQAQEDEGKSSETEKVFIPSGSMFTAVLLNGLDATTASVGQKNPMPVVFRVKREAVLPNFASIDVRECFVMAAGYGQLASERAILRTENLSCVRNDGKVIETKLDAYIVGTDGKVGMPGRLVSKQGQMIAKALLGGVLSGIGNSLDRVRAPSLNINPGGTSIYERESMSSVFQSGLAGGVSSAANQIAKFYLDMAKEMFPVVEVQAGEVGTIIVTRGTQLPLKGSTNLQQYVDTTTGNRSVTPAQSGTRSGTETNPNRNNGGIQGSIGNGMMPGFPQQQQQFENDFSQGAGW